MSVIFIRRRYSEGHSAFFSVDEKCNRPLLFNMSDCFKQVKTIYPLTCCKTGSSLGDLQDLNTFPPKTLTCSLTLRQEAEAFQALEEGKVANLLRREC